jgi:outer membrane protein assembly factor BamB
LTFAGSRRKLVGGEKRGGEGEETRMRDDGASWRVLVMAALATLGADGAEAQSCALDPKSDGPWLASPVAFEHFDSGRTHAFRCSRFSGSFDAPNVVRVEKIAENLPTPYNLVIDADGARFIYGGAYGDYPGAPGSFVARIDRAGALIWRRQLFDAGGEPERWNYPGVVGIHRNGRLYAAYADELAALDPATGRVIAKTKLPTTASPKDAAYNGFNAFSDGRLVMKSVHRAEGCSLQGFSAFMGCEGARAVANSTIAVVDPETMQVIASTEAPEHIGGRLTTAHFDGVDRLYVVGARNLHRYNWDGEALTIDEGWGPVRYIQPNQSPAPAAAVLGEWVVLQTNAVPAKTPMSIVAVNQRDGRLVRVDPWENVPPWEYTLGSKSFLPAMLSVDPDNSRIYVMDGGYGLAAAYAFNQNSGRMRRLWLKKQRTLNFSTLIGPKDARVFIATDVRGLCLFMRCLRSYAKEQIVFRNAETGEELARSAPLPKMATGALVTPLENGEIAYLGLAGEIHWVTVAPKE